MVCTYPAHLLETALQKSLHICRVWLASFAGWSVDNPCKQRAECLCRSFIILHTEHGQRQASSIHLHVYSVTSSQSSIQKEVLSSESRDNSATEKLVESVYVKQSCFNHFQEHMWRVQWFTLIRHMCKLSKPPVQVIFQYFRWLTGGAQLIA